MADGDFPTLVSLDRLPNSVTNGIFIQITNNTRIAEVDANNNLQVILAANSGVDIGDVDVTSVIPGVGATNLGKAVDAVAGAADVGVTALAVRDDVLTALTPADGDYARLRVDANGALWVTLTASGNSNVVADDSAFTVGTSFIGVSGYLADETTPDSVDEGDVGAARMTLDRRQLFVLTDATTATQRLAISSTGAASTNLTQVNGAAHSETNPVFVYQVNTVVSGTEFQDYDTASAVAGDATDNHDYSVSNTTGLLKSVIQSSSGGSKGELQAGPLASLVSKAVLFIPKQGGTVQLDFDPPIEATGTAPTFRLIRTNRQGAAQDLYSTLIGNDI